MRIARDNYREESEIDKLTNLYNKVTTERICKNLCENLKDGNHVALYIIDLDHFKKAKNNTFWHQYGDRILSEFALQLKLIFRTQDCVGMFGGDEFVIMIMGSLSEDVIRNKAQAILQATREFHIDGKPSCITASIGIAVSSLHGADYQFLFLTADKALYSVKNKGRDNFCFSVP